MLLQSLKESQLHRRLYLTPILDFSQSTDLQMTVNLIAAALKLINSSRLVCQRASVDQCQLRSCLRFVSMISFQISALSPLMCSYMYVCVSYAMAKSTGCVQMMGWTTQLACELRQKHSSDRAAGWTALLAVKCTAVMYTQPGLGGLAGANLSSAPGDRAGRI